MSERLIDLTQLLAKLGRTRHWWKDHRREIRAGGLPEYVPGMGRRWLESEIDTWLRARAARPDGASEIAKGDLRASAADDIDARLDANVAAIVGGSKRERAPDAASPRHGAAATTPMASR